MQSVKSGENTGNRRPAHIDMINTTLNAIKLDADSGLRRDLRKPLPAEQVANYENGRIGEYDFHTVFYDVFLLEDFKTVVAMGPPLLNLEKALLPAALNIDGREIKFKTKTRYKQLSVLTAKLPAQLVAFSSGDRVAEAKIAFANGWSKNIRLRPATPLHGNTIVTHQKDHKIQWIKDWANYYRSRFYIQNVVIYDNNSANQQEVIDGMAGIATVIPWAFPFGITDRSGNNYCQVGAINHLKIRYARNATIFHFDIDELLVLKTDKAKCAVLSNRQTRFNSFWVPHSPDLPARYSFADYTKRYAQPRNGAYKHAVRSDTRGVMSVHHYARAPEFLWRLLPRNVSRGPVLPLTDAYFLHYRGITTNWNKHYEGDRLSGDADAKRTVSKELVDDLSVVDALNALPES